jgi:hypothetical protein
LGERAAWRLEGDGGAVAWGVAAPWPPWKITTRREEYVGDPRQGHGVALAAAGTLEVADMAGGARFSFSMASMGMRPSLTGKRKNMWCMHYVMWVP